jgi:hypothetical protein
MERIIERELSQLMYEPIESLLAKMRETFDFRSLSNTHDDSIRRLSLTRNCLMHNVGEKGKKTGQICWREKPSVSGLESSSSAGFFALMWSNLCTRHILFGLEPGGHHDWPYKRVSRQNADRKRQTTYQD